MRGMARCYEQASCPSEFAGLACAYLRRLGYTLDEHVGFWLVLLAIKADEKRWPARLLGERVMRRVYGTAGWPPNLAPPELLPARPIPRG